jgi:hypothetical protein
MESDPRPTACPRCDTPGEGTATRTPLAAFSTDELDAELRRRYAVAEAEYWEIRRWLGP